jgi:LmbE family N-acetylglucosaminyl deacetylase
MSRIVSIGAHPDDETAFAGGMLAKYASEGHDVFIVSVTRGEGGEAGDPPLSSLDQLGATREGELRCAAAALGARDVSFLGFVDPRIAIGEPGRAIDATLDELVAAIRREIDRLRPDVVITHGSNGEYGHAQHIFTHQAVRTALAAPAGWRPSELLTWGAFVEGFEPARLLNKDDPADVILDVTPWFDAKLAALQCHATQLAMIRRNNKDESDLRKLVLRTESFRRWAL